MGLGGAMLDGEYRVGIGCMAEKRSMSLKPRN